MPRAPFRQVQKKGDRPDWCSAQDGVRTQIAQKDDSRTLNEGDACRLIIEGLLAYFHGMDVQGRKLIRHRLKFRLQSMCALGQPTQQLSCLASSKKAD